MNLSESNRIAQVLGASKSLAGDLQPWPDYFDTKAREYKTIMHFFEIGNPDSTLEIGCGNGFTSILLAGRSRNVKAFDLPSRSSKSHSLGIELACELVQRLGIKNVDVVGGSAEDLPFEDDSFDLVFSEYMLQYVPDKDKALSEVKRVLKSSGIAVTVVPNYLERAFAPVIKFEYLLGRMLSRVIETARVMSGVSDKAKGERLIEPLSKERGSSGSLLDYILLRPDGAYDSFMEEMLRHRPSSWRKLFEKNGLRVAGTFATQMLPLGMFKMMGPQAVRFVANRTYLLNNALGNLPVLKHMGYTLALVATKDK